MKLSMPFFGSSSSSGKKQQETTTISKKRKGSKSGSFGSTSSSSSSDDCASPSAVTTPRTVLPQPARSASPSAGCGNGKPTIPNPRPAAVLASAATVTREDLEVALRRVVQSEDELAAVLAEAEAAGLTPEAAAVEAAEDESELRDAFAVFDADGDGRISAEELRAVLASLGDEACSVDDCRRMIGGVDADGDGFVCFDEFSRMMMMPQPQGAAA